MNADRICAQTVLKSQDCQDSKDAVLQTLTKPSMTLTLSGLSLSGSLPQSSSPSLWRVCPPSEGLVFPNSCPTHALSSGQDHFSALASSKPLWPLLAFPLSEGFPCPQPLSLSAVSLYLELANGPPRYLHPKLSGTGEEVLRWSECHVTSCGFLSKDGFQALCSWHMEFLTLQRLEE